MLQLNKKDVVTSLEELRKAVETAMAEPVYSDYTLKSFLLNKKLTPTERIILQFLSLQTEEVKGSYIMDNLGIKGKAFRNNIGTLHTKGLVQRGFGYSTWKIVELKNLKGVL